MPKHRSNNPLPNHAARVVNEPLAVHPGKLEAILAAIGPRLGLERAEGQFFEGFGGPVEEEEAPRSRVGVLSIAGTLVSRGGMVEALSGMTSYNSIAADLQAMLEDDSVEGIVLDIDSFGGEVQGLFDLADKIAAAEKPVWGVAQHNAFSAGYALASATEKLYVPRTGGVGSIGVVAVHTDQSGFNRDAGVAYTFVHAGEKKVDGNPHSPLSDRARGDMQARVDRIYDMFVSTVASHGRMTEEQARATEAGVYYGQEAVDAGLADQVGTLQTAVADMEKKLERKNSRSAFVRQTRELLHG